jgi:hypothetical protein
MISTFRHTIFVYVRLAEAPDGQVKIDIFEVFVDLGLSSPISHSLLFGHRYRTLDEISSKPLVDKKSFGFGDDEVT